MRSQHQAGEFSTRGPLEGPLVLSLEGCSEDIERQDLVPKPYLSHPALPWTIFCPLGKLVYLLEPSPGMWFYFLAASGPSSSPVASDSSLGQDTEGDTMPEDVKAR